MEYGLKAESNLGLIELEIEEASWNITEKTVEEHVVCLNNGTHFGLKDRTNRITGDCSYLR